MTRIARRLPALLLALSLTACVAVEGPMGPPGRDGESYRLMVTAIADIDGYASVGLPWQVGVDPTQPPALTCYEAESATSGEWLVVGDGFSDTSSYCSVYFAGGRWVVEMRGMSPGWTAGWVVTY